jgi:hypothetical protein
MATRFFREVLRSFRVVPVRLLAASVAGSCDVRGEVLGEEDFERGDGRADYC